MAISSDQPIVPLAYAPLDFALDAVLSKMIIT